MKQKDFFELADELEKACGDWENSEGLSEEALSGLIAKVEAMDAEKAEKEKMEAARGRSFHMKKRYVFVLVAALTLLLGMSVVGDRVWIADSTDIARESEVTTKVNNEEKESVLLEEEEIYREIAEKLGIAPMWLGYLPKGMCLDSYTVMGGTGWAYVNYLYNGKIVSIQMTKKTKEASGNVQWDGASRKIENIENDYGYGENMEAYCIDEENLNFGAGITYGNGFYIISGFFSEEEFLGLLKGIYFKNL